MESRYGPMGLRQEYTYDEVMHAISEQPLNLDYPKRVGLRTYEDIFFKTDDEAENDTSFNALLLQRKLHLKHTCKTKDNERSQTYFNERL